MFRARTPVLSYRLRAHFSVLCSILPTARLYSPYSGSLFVVSSPLRPFRSFAGCKREGICVDAATRLRFSCPIASRLETLYHRIWSCKFYGALRLNGNTTGGPDDDDKAASFIRGTERS